MIDDIKRGGYEKLRKWTRAGAAGDNSDVRNLPYDDDGNDDDYMDERRK